VVLLDLLHRSGFKKLVVCHLDHGLRGRASAADARFVGKLAERYGYPAAVEKRDVAVLAEASSRSLETAAREARHTFFAEVAKRERCRRVFLAHHADDQVETVLMNFFRGAGPAGLAGMAEVKTLAGLELLRPLLGVWRDEISDYAAAWKLKFREDASNMDRAFLRNRVRHDLIPDIARIFGRDSRENVKRTAQIIAAEHAVLDAAAANALDRCVINGGSQISVREFLSYPGGIQRRVMIAWLQSQNVPGIGFALVGSAIAIADPQASTACVNLPGSRHLRRRSGRLFIIESE